MEFYLDLLEILEVFVKGLLWKKMIVKIVVRMVMRRKTQGCKVRAPNIQEDMEEIGTSLQKVIVKNHL